MQGMKAIRAVDYVILPCRDIDAARAFYRDVMRFPLVDDQVDWVRFQVGSCFLTLRPRGAWLMWHDGEAVPESAAVHLAFCVSRDEVDACHAELIEKGVEVIDPPTDQGFGHRTLFFRDPEANIVEIFAEI